MTSNNFCDMDLLSRLTSPDPLIIGVAGHSLPRLRSSRSAVIWIARVLSALWKNHGFHSGGRQELANG